MPPNPAPLAVAARQRHELTRSKAIKAIRELDRVGTPVTFETVARAAEVSRSWLYTQPDIRAEIARLRDATRPAAPGPSIPAQQRATADSLRRRLDAMNERNRQLRDENDQLRRQLAQALGDRRAPTRATIPDSHTSETIPPF